MATKNYHTAEEIRQQLLLKLKRVDEQIVKEKNKKYLDLGTIALKYLEKKITLDEFKAEAKSLTGLEFLGETISNKSFTENEIDSALK